MGLSFTIAAGPRQRSHSEVRVPRDSSHFTVSDLRLPQPEGPGPVFIPPSNKVAWFYPRALGSLFVTSYDSLGYGGGIHPRLQTGELNSQNNDWVLIRTAAYIAYRHPREYLLITCIHGQVCCTHSDVFLSKNLHHSISYSRKRFRNQLVSKNPSPWKRVCQRIP
jgi:hypothetical protein